MFSQPDLEKDAISRPITQLPRMRDARAIEPQTEVFSVKNLAVKLRENLLTTSEVPVFPTGAYCITRSKLDSQTKIETRTGFQERIRGHLQEKNSGIKTDR